MVCPNYSDSWMNAQAETLVLEFLKFKFLYDRQRLCVMGFSMGGTAALTFALRHRDKVAAVCDIMGVTD